MPSRHKKRKSLKQKNKSSPPPSSHENGTKGNEKHSIPHKDAVGNGNKEKRGQNSIFEFKVAETASANEMDTSRNEGSLVAAIARTEIPSESENSQNFNVFQIPKIDKSSNDLYETDKSQSFESNVFSEEFVARNDEVGWTAGLEDKDMKDFVMDNSSNSMEGTQDGEKDVILPRIEISQPPLAVRRASVWNCCGLFEVFKAFLH